ncbi:MAG: MFS transporter [Myxococcota bacterium]
MSSDQDHFDRRTSIILALLCGVVFMAVVNGTMINVALPHIGRDFEVTEGTYGWLVTGYSLTFGIFNAINGRLADLLGKRRMYMAGIFTLGAASLAVAASPSVEFAIAVRLIQGAGAAALPVLGTAIVREVVSPERQGHAVGYILSTVGVGASIGPFLGGLIVQFASWRMVFLVTGLTLCALPVAMRVLPAQLDERAPGHFDWTGAGLLSLGVVGLLYSFEILESGAPIWQLAALLGVSATLLVGFWLWIGYAREPFVRRSLFQHDGYIASCIVGATTNGARFASVVLVPIFLTELHHMAPLKVGAVLFPGAVAIALISPKSGDWADAHGPRRPVQLGLVILGLGGALTAAFAGGSAWGVTGGMTLFGIGYAFAQSPLVSTINRIVPREEAGAGVGLFMMIFFMGGAAGVAACVTTVELLAKATWSLPAPFAPEGSRFAIALLGLSIPCILSLPVAPYLPDAGAREAASHKTHSIRRTPR